MRFEDRGRRLHAKTVARIEQGKEPQESYEGACEDLPLERSLIESKTTKTLRESWGLAEACWAPGGAHSRFLHGVCTGVPVHHRGSDREDPFLEPDWQG